MPPPKAKEKEKYIKMREPKEIQEPLKTVRNTKTKLLRQATPEEIIKLAIKAEVNKKAAEKTKEIEAAAKEASDAKEEKAEAKAEEEKKVEAAKAEKAEAETKATAEAAAEEAVKAEAAATADAALKALPDQTFYWVKNAESIANLYNNEETDTYSNKDAQKALNKEKVAFRENNKVDLSEYISFDTEGGALSPPPIPPASAKPAFTKRNHSKFPITVDLKEWIKKLFKNQANLEKIQKKYTNIGDKCDPAKIDYDFKKCLKQVQADFKGEELQQAYASLLMSISFYTFIQPTLSEGGMVQARILGEQIIKRKLIELQPETSIILCAATVPAMMTAYLTAGYAELPNAQIYIVPYLNEKESEESKLFFNGSKNLRDFANYAISPKVISEVGAKILAWFDKNKIYDASGALLNDIKKDINKNKPLFDYTYYPATGEGDDALREGDLTKFFTWFDATIKDKPNVLVFSHDTPVKEVRQQTFLNTKIDDKPIDDTNPISWNANTAVFQHKRQGGILRPIFPADAVPKLSAPPFPPELAQCGLIYYPNNGVEKTTIRNRKDLEKETEILLMDKFNEENQKLISKSIMTEANDLGLRDELNSIIHGEDLDKKGAYEKWETAMQRKVEILEYRANADPTYLPKTYIEPTPDYMNSLGYETPNQQTDYLAAYEAEFNAELENIRAMIDYFFDKLKETKKANDIDPNMEEEVKTVEQRLIDYKKKYSEPLSAPVDDKAKLKAKLEEEITKAETVKLQELHELITSFIGARNSPADLSLTKTKLAEIADLKEKKKKVTNDEASDKVLQEYKTEYKIARGGSGGRSKKKRNKRPKKSIRKNPKQKKNKSKKKKGGKKVRKRTFKKQPLKKVAPNI